MPRVRALGWGGGWGARGHQMDEAVMGGRGVGGFGPLPRAWLHRRQIVLPLSRVLSPPYATGMMWSGSALCGCLLMS